MEEFPLIDDCDNDLEREAHWKKLSQGHTEDHSTLVELMERALPFFSFVQEIAELSNKDMSIV